MEEEEEEEGGPRNTQSAEIPVNQNGLKYMSSYLYVSICNFI